MARKRSGPASHGVCGHTGNPSQAKCLPHARHWAEHFASPVSFPSPRSTYQLAITSSICKPSPAPTSCPTPLYCTPQQICPHSLPLIPGSSSLLPSQAPALSLCQTCQGLRDFHAAELSVQFSVFTWPDLSAALDTTDFFLLEMVSSLGFQNTTLANVPPSSQATPSQPCFCLLALSVP